MWFQYFIFSIDSQTFNLSDLSISVDPLLEEFLENKKNGKTNSNPLVLLRVFP